MSRNAGNDENGEFDDNSPKTKIQANDLKTRAPTKVPNMANLANIVNFTLFRQRPRFRRMSSRQGYQQSGEYGEFGKYCEFDDISSKIKMQPNELKTRVPATWGIRRICRM